MGKIDILPEALYIDQAVKICILNQIRSDK